jgi:hypothetical protein
LGTIALLALTAMVNASPIEVITQTATFEMNLGPNQVTKQFEKFDPSLGELVKVRMIFNTAISAKVNVENTSDVLAPAFVLQIEGSTTATRKNVSSFSSGGNLPKQNVTAPFVLGPYDGIPGAWDGISQPPDYKDLGLVTFNVAQSENETSNATTMHDYFTKGFTTGQAGESLNNLEVVIAESAGYTFSGGVAASVNWTELKGSGTVTLEYYYVPEPMTMGLFALGGLLAARRRRS